MLIHDIKEGCNTTRLYATLSTDGGFVLIYADLGFILLEILKNDWTVSNFKEAMDKYVNSKEYQEHKKIHKQFMLLSKEESKKEELIINVDNANDNVKLCFNIDSSADADVCFNIKGEYDDEYIEIHGRKDITLLRDFLTLYLDYWEDWGK